MATMEVGRLPWRWGGFDDNHGGGEASMATMEVGRGQANDCYISISLISVMVWLWPDTTFFCISRCYIYRRICCDGIVPSQPVSYYAYGMIYRD